MEKTEKKDRSEEARAKWPRQPGEDTFECKCGRLFGADDLGKCDASEHGNCAGHCPYCGQQVSLLRSKK